MDEAKKSIFREFVKWIKVKVRIHTNENSLSFKQRDIWWANIGLNVGFEQNGKNDEFERPVLVLRKFGQNIFWAIPMTSKENDNKYRMKIRYKEYYKNIVGDLLEEEKEGNLILNQLRTISNKRLIRKMGVISEVNFDIVRNKIKSII
jgi:mRNA interferase MazF